MTYISDGEAYEYVHLTEANSNPGMYQGVSQCGDIDAYWRLDCFLEASDAVDHLCTLDDDWRKSADTELVDRLSEIEGKCYDEPLFLIASRNSNGEVFVSGWTTFDREADWFAEMRERYGDWYEYEWLFE